VRKTAWLLVACSLLGCRTPPCEQPLEPVHVTDPLACRPGTPEHEDARGRLDALDRQIEALQLGDPLERRLEIALHELRASRCFERSVEHSEWIKFGTSAVLREWWLRGGREWFESYLQIAAPSDSIVLPPTPRRVLYAEAVQGTALAELVCPELPELAGSWEPSLVPWLEPGECGFETVVWLKNAQQAHEYWALWSNNWQVPAVSARHRDRAGLRVNPVGERCRHSIEHDLLPSYTRWRACVEAERGRMSMLPHGAFRPPEHGWLISKYIVFRVGDSCSDYTAYHLETGAAHWGKRCEDGSSERHSGTVPVDRVREALLISMLAEYAVDGAPFVEVARAPDGVPIIWPEGARPLHWREPTLGVQVDHETTVRYRWWDSETLAEGYVDGPYHGTGAEAHARSLYFDLHGLRREGPAPAELPDELWDSFAREPD
jgi:hypothetical protein